MGKWMDKAISMAEGEIPPKPELARLASFTLERAKQATSEHSEAIAEHLAERAAIQEYDGGLTREQAARGCAVVEALSIACRGLPIVSVDLHHALATEDIGDLQSGEINDDALAAFARSLAQRMDMEQGKVPAHYTERATCRRCGPIWLWFAGEVEGCPWCWQRVAGRTIPCP